ncbi:hypothetical protein HAX54_017459, partial [Datura stramonium]|nr:hypothetical protein [Datura stramonium]
NFKKRIRVDREKNQNKRAKSVDNNEWYQGSIGRNLFDERSSSISPSTMNAPPPRSKNDRRGQNGKTKNHRASELWEDFGGHKGRINSLSKFSHT